MLFDNDSSTKFYTRAAKATEEDPVWVQFSLNSEKGDPCLRGYVCQ